MPEALELPVLMRASQFAREFDSSIGGASEGDLIGLSTMQLAIQPQPYNQIVAGTLDRLIAADERGVGVTVSVDEAYVNRMTRVGLRDFPDALPMLSAAKRSERKSNRTATDEAIAQLAARGILVAGSVHAVERGYTPRLRHWPSRHLLQNFAVRHAKEAHIVGRNGDVTSWVTNANYTDSDLTDPNPDTQGGMNNLAIRLHGNLARFVVRAMGSGYGRSAGMNFYRQGNVMAIHDINNAGEPARLPYVLQTVLASVDPRRAEEITDPTMLTTIEPTHIVLLSQYLPDGLLLAAADQASRHANVYIPRQPTNDHRSRAFPYNVHSFAQTLRMNRTGIYHGRREVSSHVKAAICRYDDGTARVVVATDNFATHLQKAVRNEELAVVVDIDLKTDQGQQYFTDAVCLLCTMGEITESAKIDLLS